jgi:DNA repair ATPase RecN
MTELVLDLEAERAKLTELENALELATKEIPSYLQPTGEIQGVLTEVKELLAREDLKAGHKHRVEALKNQIKERRELIQSLEERERRKEALDRICSRVEQIEALAKEFNTRSSELVELGNRLKALSVANDVDRSLLGQTGTTLEGMSQLMNRHFVVFENGRGYVRDNQTIRAHEREKLGFN